MKINIDVNFNPYHLIRTVLFRIDAEKAHELTLRFLKYHLLPKLKNDVAPILHTEICGLPFLNPVGLAAGFDKNAEVIDEMLNLGFGSVELGSITPRPQPGNPQPRLFRAVDTESAINRFGFNSEGADTALRRISAWYDSHTKKNRGIIGINLGKNKDTANAVTDYLTGLAKFAPFAGYIAINISSPNTAGLRDLQSRAPLTDLLTQFMAAHASSKFKPPIFVKIAPDQTEDQLQDIVEVVMASGVHGMIVGNTTVARPSLLPPDLAREAGGLSGKLLFEPSTEILRRVYQLTQGKLPLIGCGGISSGEDAYAKIRAGASLVQLYTALVYEGPLLVSRINRDLAALLLRDGFRSVVDAVGVDAL